MLRTSNFFQTRQGAKFAKPVAYKPKKDLKRVVIPLKTIDINCDDNDISSSMPICSEKRQTVENESKNADLGKTSEVSLNFSKENVNDGNCLLLMKGKRKPHSNFAIDA